MWYALVEQQRYWLRMWSELVRQALGSWPAPSLSRATATYFDDLLTPILNPAATPPPFAFEPLVLDSRRHAIAEAVVAGAPPFCALRRFSRTDRPPAPRAILLCVPLSGHAAVMMRETVAALLEDGDVYVTDWLNARDVPLASGHFGLDDYVRMLDGFLGTLLADARPLHVVAICQATFPTLGALALRASGGTGPPVSVAMICGPLDARRNPSMLGRAANSHSLEWCHRHLIDVVPAGFAGHGREVFPTYLQQVEITAVYPLRYLSLIDRYADATSHDDPDALAEARTARLHRTARHARGIFSRHGRPGFPPGLPCESHMASRRRSGAARCATRYCADYHRGASRRSHGRRTDTCRTRAVHRDRRREAVSSRCRGVRSLWAFHWSALARRGASCAAGSVPRR